MGKGHGLARAEMVPGPHSIGTLVCGGIDWNVLVLQLTFPNISRLFANICNLALLHAAPLDAHCLDVGLTNAYAYM